MDDRTVSRGHEEDGYDGPRAPNGDSLFRMSSYLLVFSQRPSCFKDADKLKSMVIKGWDRALLLIRKHFPPDHQKRVIIR